MSNNSGKFYKIITNDYKSNFMLPRRQKDSKIDLVAGGYPAVTNQSQITAPAVGWRTRKEMFILVYLGWFLS